MNYKQHVMIGLASAGIASYYDLTSYYELSAVYPFQQGLFHTGLYYVGAIFGSLLPDIDHPSSYIGRKLPGLSKSISKLFGHRGFTHSIVCVAALYFGLTELKEQVPSVPALGITIGYISHLLADSLTPQGAQLLYPLQVRLFKPTTFMKKLLRR